MSDEEHSRGGVVETEQNPCINWHLSNTRGKSKEPYSKVMTLERAMKRRLLQAIGVVVTLPQVDEAECELVQ